MSEAKLHSRGPAVELEYQLDEAPQKVWRALAVAEFREQWLPRESLALPDPTAIIPDREVRYRMRDDAPPYLESTVTFEIRANDRGGTHLRIRHELDAPKRVTATRPPANSNRSPIRMAA